MRCLRRGGCCEGRLRRCRVAMVGWGRCRVAMVGWGRCRCFAKPGGLGRGLGKVRKGCVRRVGGDGGRFGRGYFGR